MTITETKLVHSFSQNLWWALKEKKGRYKSLQEKDLGLLLEITEKLIAGKGKEASMNFSKLPEDDKRILPKNILRIIMKYEDKE
jgi:hypothetical protein